jgi:hypothetical protein
MIFGAFGSEITKIPPMLGWRRCFGMGFQKINGRGLALLLRSLDCSLWVSNYATSHTTTKKPWQRHPLKIVIFLLWQSRLHFIAIDSV